MTFVKIQKNKIFLFVILTAVNWQFFRIQYFCYWIILASVCASVFYKSKMALADICGLNNVIRRNDMSMDALKDDLLINSGNMENNYQLAMPPYENVRLTFDDIAIYISTNFNLNQNFVSFSASGKSKSLPRSWKIRWSRNQLRSRYNNARFLFPRWSYIGSWFSSHWRSIHWITIDEENCRNQ